MRSWQTIRGLLDRIEEEIALASGVLLTDHDLFELLQDTPMEEWVVELSGDAGRKIGVRPEYVSDIIRTVRAAIGNLPDATPAHRLWLRGLKDLVDRGHDPLPIVQAFSDEIVSGRHDTIGEEVVDAVKKKAGAPLLVVQEIFLLLAEQHEREPENFFRQEPIDWDGVTSLSELFSTETLPKGEKSFLDQKFIDFLASRPEKLDRIHWRNFERLTAEFFEREGYLVKLGPGTKDGGVDLRVWSKVKPKGPPLLLVQCKRYSDGNLVEIEYVKALWADLEFEGAERGLIATTSRVTPAGERICQARKYPLTFAENEKVREWVSSMWRHSWQGKGKTVGVGKYLLPPFYIVPEFDQDDEK